MPRFNHRRWNPSKDSSPRHFTTAVKDRKIHLDRAYEGEVGEGTSRVGCPCGCVGFPKGRGVFAMGHDARFRGILIRAHLTGTPIVYHVVHPGGVSDGNESEGSAMEIAQSYGASFVKALEEAEARRDLKNREVLTRALGSKRLIRVGRWEYTGQVAAVYGDLGDEQYDVEYVTKSGEVRRKRVDAADTEEVAA